MQWYSKKDDYLEVYETLDLTRDILNQSRELNFWIHNYSEAIEEGISRSEAPGLLETWKIDYRNLTLFGHPGVNSKGKAIRPYDIYLYIDKNRTGQKESIPEIMEMVDLLDWELLRKSLNDPMISGLIVYSTKWAFKLSKKGNKASLEILRNISDDESPTYQTLQTIDL